MVLEAGVYITLLFYFSLLLDSQTVFFPHEGVLRIFEGRVVSVFDLMSRLFYDLLLGRFLTLNVYLYVLLYLREEGRCTYVCYRSYDEPIDTRVYCLDMIIYLRSPEIPALAIVWHDVMS